MKPPDRSCDPKTRLTRSQASERVKTLRVVISHTRRTKPHSIHPYHCMHCGGWHIGHDGPPKKSRYKRKKRVDYFPEESPEQDPQANDLQEKESE